MKKLREIILASSIAFSTIGLIGCSDEGDNGGNDESTYQVSISGTVSASEGGNGAAFTISLDESNTSEEALTISYDVSGTATSESDFQALSGSASIAIGSSQAVVNLTVIDDQDVEEDETVVVSLSENLPDNVELGSTTTYTLTIIDNDESTESCENDNSTNQTNDPCDYSSSTRTFTESVTAGMRTITGSGIPDHDYGNQFDDIPMSDVQVTNQNYNLTFTANPTLSSNTTSILNPITGQPKYKFGIAINSVPIDPAPATPFIFTVDDPGGPNDGEYNWDWVFEPNNNMSGVGLDCAVAHVQPDGAYHYHGDMAPLAELESAGISSGTTPSSPVLIGWSADGFPIVYRYGPNSEGNGIVELTSSYQLKSGSRPGDGMTEPCGEYNGKYTNDYEYVESIGDLDECNGITRNITVSTSQGTETFSYFYVITAEFPIISRCFSGTPDADFEIGAP